MMSAAEAITKMLGNKAILINQITPDNFLKTWGLLKPLMKDIITGQVEIDYKAKLLDLVVLKDNIGEAFWYVYTAILISSVVYYNLASRGCVKSAAQIKAGYDQYKEEATPSKTLDCCTNRSIYSTRCSCTSTNADR